MFDQYIKESGGFVVVYSIDERFGFERAAVILASIESIKGEKFKAVLIGNKIDQQTRVVAQNEGSRLAAKHNIKFFETSCETSENVQLAFKNLVKCY